MTRHRPEQVIAKLRQAEAELAQGHGIAQVCQKLAISEQTFHRWRNQYGGMKAEEAKKLKELEVENARLKRLVAELSLDKQMLQEVAQKSGDARAASPGRASPVRDLRGIPTPCLSRAGPTPFDAEAVPKTQGGGRTARGADVGAGATPSALRLSTDLGITTPRRVAGQPEADLASVATTGTESPSETEKETASG